MTKTRFASIVTLLFVTGVSGSALAASPAGSPAPSPTTQSPSAEANLSAASLRGIVTDERGQVVVGAFVSVTGETNGVAITDGTGRFVVAGLPQGPYLVRVHQRGFVPARAMLVQARRGTTDVPVIRLVSANATRVLAAGVADSPGITTTEDDPEPDPGELAWRLRHARRGALDEVTVAARPVRSGADDGPMSWMPVLPFSGEFNLLTSASFDRPQDLFMDRLAPTGLAYLALESPAPGGTWRMRGTLTQGDVSAWMASGGYSRVASAAHAYEAGGSFARQRYDGGNAAALAAMTGPVFAADELDWGEG